MIMNDAAGVHIGSPAQTKIALFRSLFRGREDVYPRRFESLRTGQSGYAPACANEWRPGVCEKPRIRCAVCPNRQFLPVTDDVIHWHLTGADDAGEPFTAGVYPMLLDETCHLLAVDFDGKTWGDDASAYLSTCTKRGVPAALERSRSGNGGHVWLFFDTAVAAGLARRLGALLLTETMDDRPDLGFRSYDRFFPSQDTLPHGGFGNLIALPLQGKPRKSGNSVFVDTNLNPFADQWAYLSELGRVPANKAESLVREAEKDGRVLGVKAVEKDELLASARPQHVCAEDLQRMLDRHGTPVSRATVYNTLGLFARKGLVRELFVDSGKVLYDSNTANHDHIYDADTGVLTDIEPGAVAVSAMPSLPAGTRVESVEVVIRVRRPHRT